MPPPEPAPSETAWPAAAVAAPAAASDVRILRTETLFSDYLGRLVQLTVVLPPGHDPAAPALYPVLCLNDGQDFDLMQLPATLRALYRRHALRPFVLVAIRAHNRLQEYGVGAAPDYLGRGSRAAAYGEFVRYELLPHVQAAYHGSANPADVVLAGCSLGGLTAVDQVWSHPEAALRAGAFSGAFWWRSRALDNGYTDADRLLHGLVRVGHARPGQAFWLQTGTLDETNDRNHNGIIDSIEDTLDLLTELHRAGLPESQARYVEVVGGRHNQRTWARAMPGFLCWAFGPDAAVGADGSGAAAADVSRLIGWRQYRVRRALRARRPGLARPVVGVAADAPVVGVAADAPVVGVAADAPVASAAAPVSVSSVIISTTLPSLTTMLHPPAPTEYPAFYEGYLSYVTPGADPLGQLQQQPLELRRLLGHLSDEQAGHRYAPDKWSIKEVLGHMLDTERIFAYRALRIARHDQQAMPGFEQDDYVRTAGSDERLLTELLDEYDTVRAATLSLFRSFRPEAYGRLGVASGGVISVRALVHILPGHEAHHLRILQERYLPNLA